MLGVSGLMDGAEAADSGGCSSEVGVEEIGGGGGGGGGGNRWPRQETLALLKIRSDMDVVFRDSSLKGPLWEKVSRKMSELGFQRSAKKCKEKFENVYKYHKRTKDGRASKSEGKTYRFFDQLQALDNTPPPPPPPPTSTITVAQPMPVNTTNLPMPTVPSTTPNPLTTIMPPIQPTNTPINASSFQPPPPHLSILRSNSTSSSSTSSDEGIKIRRGKKRKWKDFFEKLMEDVICKQEELQKKFLDTLEKHERDRLGREEAWRVQETARVKREHELLVQERSAAAAKDAAVIAFLRNVTGQNHLQIPITNNAPPRQPPENPPPPLQPEAPPHSVGPPIAAVTPTSNGGDNSMSIGSSRWPKAEIQALINLRTSMDVKYQENGPKGPLWEEISVAMAKLGYNRSPKRCKEKWENINKYFKKVKESNKKRPEDSKTCPYFHQLEALYKDRTKNVVPTFNPGFAMAPIMARPEQQWPDQQNSAMCDQGEDYDNEENNEADDAEGEEDEGGGYEIVTTKQPSSATNGA